MVYASVPRPTNDEKCDELKEQVALPEQTIADIMHEASALAEDALQIASRISGFLFPNTNAVADRPEECSCFRDELLKTRYELHITVKKLVEIAHMLGA